MKKILFITLGLLSFALACLGAVLPLIPTVPFLLLSAFCFGRSSEGLNRWFLSTKLYQNNLESYVKGEGMTRKTKVKTLSMVTLLMGIGFYFMEAVPVARGVLALVWLVHLVYFIKFVKTKEEISDD